MKPPLVRCAIYTRMSSEEGLDQAFNSLDAQREACEAYVLSQTGEGWSAIAAGRERRKCTGGGTGLLTGIIFDAMRRPMSPTISYGRGGRRYRYYASAPLQKGAIAGEDIELRRIPGATVDDFVADAVTRIARSRVARADLRAVLRRVEVLFDEIHSLFAACKFPVLFGAPSGVTLGQPLAEQGVGTNASQGIRNPLPAIPCRFPC